MRATGTRTKRLKTNGNLSGEFREFTTFFYAVTATLIKLLRLQLWAFCGTLCFTNIYSTSNLSKHFTKNALFSIFLTISAIEAETLTWETISMTYKTLTNSPDKRWWCNKSPGKVLCLSQVYMHAITKPIFVSELKRSLILPEPLQLLSPTQASQSAYTYNPLYHYWYWRRLEAVHPLLGFF